MIAREFRINQYLSVRLEDGKANIYVDGKRFIQCRQLVLNIPLIEGEDYSALQSIDEMKEKFTKVRDGKGFEPKVSTVHIEPEDEFWGHCSNLAAWYEHGYDIRLLHSNLSIPLLLELYKAGDESALNALQFEIAERLRTGTDRTRTALLRRIPHSLLGKIITPLFDDLDLDTAMLYLKKDLGIAFLKFLDENGSKNARLLVNERFLDLYKGISRHGFFHREDRIILDIISPQAFKKCLPAMDTDQKRAIAKRVDVPGAILVVLSTEVDPVTRGLTGKNTSTPRETVLHLAKDEVGSVRASAASTIQDVKILRAFSNDRDVIVRRAVAKNPNTPRDVLNTLVDDIDKHVRRGVASNQNTSIEGFQKLTKYMIDISGWDEPSYLDEMSEQATIMERQGVARNPNAPPQVLEKLARDSRLSIREMVASHPNTPPRILDKLARDEFWDVKGAVSQNPHAPGTALSYLVEIEGEFKYPISARRDAPLSTLEFLATDEDEHVRRNVAKNPNTPPNVLKILARDELAPVRCAVAMNPRTPLQILQDLLQDENDEVREGARKMAGGDQPTG